jgi:YfiH family protein
MNVAKGLGDPDTLVEKNISLFAARISNGTLDASAVVCTSQIHSAKIRRITAENRGEGSIRPAGESCDGFITDAPGVLVMIRMADCTPILFSARREDGSSIVCAVHAGWRGTVAGIAAEAIRQIGEMGGSAASVRCAVGQAIQSCCYEVKEDFYEAVSAARGTAFAAAHIRPRDGKLFADVPGMNVRILRECGLAAEQIDVLPPCTACRADLFHSHRATGGLRGAMGAMIGIKK